MIGLYVILGISVLLIAAVVAGPWLRRRRRQRFAAAAFPASWESFLTRNVPVYRRLPADLRQRLQDAVKVFLAEKPFYGCNQLEVTEEMRVTIAAQACVLVTSLGIDRYDHVRTILLYPDTFVTAHEHYDEAGVHSVQEKELGGESWPEGKVVLSWRDICEGMASHEDPRSVVVHEFAHQLDQADGDANGAPLLEDAGRYRRWSAVFQREYEQLQRAVDAGEETLLPEDAAEHPGEFFAYTTELFIDQPHALRTRHPELYNELSDYFGFDPCSWSVR